MTRDELINSPEYLHTKIQIDVFNKVNKLWVECNHDLKKVKLFLGIEENTLHKILQGEMACTVKQLCNLLSKLGLSIKIYETKTKKRRTKKLAK